MRAAIAPKQCEASVQRRQSKIELSEQVFRGPRLSMRGHKGSILRAIIMPRVTNTLDSSGFANKN